LTNLAENALYLPRHIRFTLEKENGQ